MAETKVLYTLPHKDKGLVVDPASLLDVDLKFDEVDFGQFLVSN